VTLCNVEVGYQRFGGPQEYNHTNTSDFNTSFRSKLQNCNRIMNASINVGKRFR